jgi:hypothetical protein
MHESFKKETVVGLNKVNSILGNLLKSGRVINSSAKDGNIKSSASVLDRHQAQMMDDDAFTFLEGRMTEQEKELRKAMGENRRDLTDMINSANATIDDLKTKYNKLSKQPLISATGHSERRNGFEDGRTVVPGVCGPGEEEGAGAAVRGATEGRGDEVPDGGARPGVPRGGAEVFGIGSGW